MSAFFHLPALGLLALAVLLPRRRPGVRPWIVGSIGLAVVGTVVAVMASGGSPFRAMRFGCWLIFAYLPVHALCAAWVVRRRSPRVATTYTVAAGLVLAVGGWAFWVEPLWLEVTRYEVRSPKLDRSIRVAVLADLQTDRVGSYERRALATLMAVEPDLILLPGDYLQIGDPAERDRQAAALRDALAEIAFTAPLGVYATRGDVEVDGWESIFDGTGVTTFEKTTRVERPELVITALSPRDARLRRGWPRRTERFHLAFGHAPEFALDQEQLDKPSADLSIAGHTHGGQVRLPFVGPIVTFSGVPRAWAAGRTNFANGGTLIVSRGVGMERGPAPRLRFLCRPEIVVIDLVPSED